MSKIHRTIQVIGGTGVDAPGHPSHHHPAANIGATMATAASGVRWSEKPPEAWGERQNAVAGDKGFLRPAWFTGWTPYGGSSKSWSGPTRYLSVISDNLLCGVMPIGFQTSHGLRFAALAGNYIPFRSVAIFENPAATAAQMVSGISSLSNVDGARLGPLPTTDKDLNPLRTAFRDAGWRLIETDIATVFSIALPRTVGEYERDIPSKRKKRLRYYWNSMCKSGATEIVHYNDASAEGWDAVFTDLAIVESAAWVSKFGEPRFKGARNQLFWSHLSKDPWMRKAMHAWVIYHGGRPVSLCFAIDSGDTRYILANSYDAKVAKFSTGSKIYNEVILDAIGRAYSTVNIGMGDPGYKSRWGAEGREAMIDVFAFPPTPKGFILYVAARAKFGLAAVRDWFIKKRPDRE